MPEIKMQQLKYIIAVTFILWYMAHETFGVTPIITIVSMLLIIVAEAYMYYLTQPTKYPSTVQARSRHASDRR